MSALNTASANTIPEGYGVCPKCNGCKELPLSEREKTYSWYAGKTGRPCTNCGAQTMYGQATGIVLLRKDNNEPCLHEYNYTKLGNCYHGYNCKHCGHSYQIDSGD